ncbi:hypothetical protein [Myceligenerans indicum]|uniref:Sulfotransferase family protein n=1 Tax=Myceligenerans indicum TaxID=2593663 RepID=A0ABS1LP25_9MICO|nr:hypothetical protein [Myceligenerans indicum]MBL0887538.1 hypothetical protein [Myceligenerans indicum]
MVSTRCVLHIGAEKTGTTAVQTALKRQSAELLGHGVLYPRALRTRRGISHTGLATYAADPHRVDDLRRAAGLTTPARVETHRHAVRRALLRELSSGEPPATVLLSSEHCQSRLRTVAEVRDLRELLAEFCDDVTVVLYLRPQHEVALSLYSTRMKAGLPPTNPLSEDSAEPGYFDYGGLVTRWATVFGAANLRVRTFEPDRLIGGSILDDFADVTRLPVALRRSGGRANPSLSPRGIRVLGAANTVVPRFLLGRVNPLRLPLTRLVEQLFRGSGPVVDPDEAATFYERFAESNDVVRSMYFPGRPTLFSPDFSVYERAR